MDQKHLQEQQELWENHMSLPVQISGVLFALDLIFLQNLVQTSSLTGWKTCSLLFFAIALPCLARPLSLTLYISNSITNS